MSRSRRHSPFCSIACRGLRHSEKLEKRMAHRRRRRWEHAHPHLPPRSEKEFGEPWCWQKDGRQRIDPDSREMRK